MIEKTASEMSTQLVSVTGEDSEMTPTLVTTKLIYSSLGGDEDLADIVEMFVDEMPERTQNLVDLAAANNLDELRRFAHQLKGAAGSYGFNQLTPYAAELESAVRDRQPRETVHQALNALVAECALTRAGVPE
jgi:HPt (histidine-containing phosphotransfer) domain-containing protein